MAFTYLRATKNLNFVLLCNPGQTLDGSIPSWTPDWFYLRKRGDCPYRTWKDNDSTDHRWRAAGISPWRIPNTDNSESRCIRVEYLFINQLDGLSTVYGNTNPISNAPDRLIQPSPHNSQSSSSSTAMQKTDQDSIESRLKVLESLRYCLCNGPSLCPVTETVEHPHGWKEQCGFMVAWLSTFPGTAR
jgi:hypothetical protein